MLNVMNYWPIITRFQIKALGQTKNVISIFYAIQNLWKEAQ